MMGMRCRLHGTYGTYATHGTYGTHGTGVSGPNDSPFEGGYRGMFRLSPATRVLISALAVLALSAMVLSGCLSAGEVKPVNYYFLDPPLNVENRTPGNDTLGVHPLNTALPLDRRMAYRTEGAKVGYRTTEWADRPGDAATRALLDALVASQRFRDVGLASEMSRPDLVLTGELRRFYENRTVSPATAEAEIRFELRKARDNAGVWSETLHVEKPIDGEDATALAAAMSQALGELISKAVNSMTP